MPAAGSTLQAHVCVGNARELRTAGAGPAHGRQEKEARNDTEMETSLNNVTDTWRLRESALIASDALAAMHCNAAAAMAPPRRPREPSAGLSRPPGQVARAGKTS